MLLLSISFCTGQPVHAQDAHLSGLVTAEPRVKPASDGEGGGAYGSRGLEYAVKFDYSHLKNVVVYAEPISPVPSSPSGEDVTIRKSGDNLRVDPAFSTIPTGASLTFKNETGKVLDLYALPGSADSLRLTINPGSSKPVTMTTIGLYQIRCLQSPDLAAKIFVAGPYFSMADAQGRYSLDLREGKYRVTAWHERLPSHTEDVDVKAGEDRQINFDLSVKQLPEVQ